MAGGDFRNGIEQLDRVRVEFEALGVVNDSALVRLELAEALLVANRPSRVPDLLRNIIVSFASEGMMRNANMALAFLKEALQKRRASVRVVRYVREYLEELSSRPSATFIPPR